MRGSVRIQRERCKGCCYCVDACPAGVLEISTQFNAIGYFPAVAAHKERCTGCGICATVCPDIAITVFRVKNKSGR
ncbi:MAG: 4Fe-4S binding protein [Nitrospiraceae bacterium]|nr:4Fe-4S binding protein [Nitrospiraceae bacterium]